MSACIIGWAHSRFGKLADDDVESLIGQVAPEAIADAGIEPGDVDAVYVGHFNAGFSRQTFTAPLVLQNLPELRFKPSMRVEDACATGSAAIYAALNAIAARRARVVLVVGVEKMTELQGEDIGETLLKGCYLKEEGADGAGFAGIFAQIARAYFDKYGDQTDALARIAAKNHRNGASNPLAQIQKDLGFEFCRTASDKNPIVATPLKRTDCSMVSDGAAAVVLADMNMSCKMPKAVAFRAAELVGDYLPMSKRDMLESEGPAYAWRRALDTAKVDLFDLDLVETHDCFTIAELMQYEAMGLTSKGEGAHAVLEGWTDKEGKLPVNPSGGLKSKGHPIGATGVSMHVLASMQVVGAAPGSTQIPGAALAGIFNMGGTAVANYVSVLERLR